MTTSPLISLDQVRPGASLYERCEGDLEARDRRRGGVVVAISGDNPFIGDDEFHTVSIRHGKLTYHTLRADQVDPETIDRLDRVQCRLVIRWCAEQIAQTHVRKTDDDRENAELTDLADKLAKALVGPGWSGG